MPDQVKSSFPSWLMPLLSLALGIVGSLVTFSHKYGRLEETTATNARRIDALEADKAKRDAADAARLASYEQARAAKMAQIEAIADRLKDLPANPPR